ncbi:hypothetical protein GGQ11_002769 [Salinibacter ruber]|uniref:arylsulfotransferase family protein n=1 Tax=Salinibacter ruber TaxID=146919 RepID=UPI0021692F3C|nr:arylsulfotransferase family protein [Salinibacter ruber]MCS3657968.1 hypothetical protein [Salinibacter ruber]MCS4169875.1 hypothetical protein [Salinibacter ruber]
MKLTIAKAYFVVSVAVLGVGYGIAANQWGLFPAPLVEQAWPKFYWTFVDEPQPLRTSRTYDREGIRLEKPDLVQPGKTFISSAWEGPEGLKAGFRLINEEGEVLHKWRFDRTDLFPDSISQRRSPLHTEPHGSHLLPDGDVLVNLDYVGTARLNSCGEVLWAMGEGSHHSITQEQNGTFWISAVSQAQRTESQRYPDGFPGLGRVWLDRILNIDDEGEILRDINVLDILYENGLERYLFKYGERTGDVTHLNDVEPLPPAMADEYPLFQAGDLLVSLRNINLVFVFDPAYMEVKWHATKPFIQQHDPDFVGDGWIGIFDNNRDYTGRGAALGGSRIVSLQPRTDSVRVKFPTRASEPFYTERRGKWQMLGNGNMLLVEAKAGRVVEVESDGKTVWEWIHSPFDDATVPFVHKAIRVDLAREEIASWPCSTIDSNSTSARGR